MINVITSCQDYELFIIDGDFESKILAEHENSTGNVIYHPIDARCQPLASHSAASMNGPMMIAKAFRSQLQDFFNFLR